MHGERTSSVGDCSPALHVPVCACTRICFLKWRIEGQKSAYMQVWQPQTIRTSASKICFCRMDSPHSPFIGCLPLYQQERQKTDSHGSYLRPLLRGTRVGLVNARCAHSTASCNLIIEQRLPIHRNRLCHQSAPETGRLQMSSVLFIFFNV